MYIFNVVHQNSRRRVSVLTWLVAYMHVVKEVGEETAMLGGRMMISKEMEAVMITKSEENPRTWT